MGGFTVQIFSNKSCISLNDREWGSFELLQWLQFLDLVLKMMQQNEEYVCRYAQDFQWNKHARGC